MANNAQHVYFLQKKKAEILARKEREKAKNAPKPEVPIKVETPQLQFANDGSFLERFKLMQKQQQLLSKSSASSSPVSKNISNVSPVTSKNLTDAEKQTLKLSATKSQPELRVPASIFKQEDEEADAYQPSEYDLAKELAEKVSEEGVEVEAEARKKHQGDSRYKFLFDPSYPVAQYYQSQLRLFKPAGKSAARKRRWNDEDSLTIKSESPPLSSSSGSPSTSDGSKSVPAPTMPVDPMVEFAKAKALMKAKAAALVSGAAPVPKVISEEEKKRARAIDEQRMMNELYRKVIEQQALFAQAASKKAKAKDDKPRYEYDSDEDTEGGTWEHKKRKLEMKKTQEWAGDLTDKGRGKHHLADFLPPEELERFMENVKAVQEGRSADISDYAKFKIQADNVGFQLLQKAGWVEGTGLGTKGEGIVQPINKGKTSFDQSGVGVEMPLDVKKGDDDFELYRKRMMLAYKFRPNPLNNPRRPYY